MRSDNPTVCPAGQRVDREHRPRSAQVWDALDEAHQGDADLPAHGQPACGSALLGHTKIKSTVRYLSIEIDDAIEIAEKIDV